MLGSSRSLSLWQGFFSLSWDSPAEDWGSQGRDILKDKCCVIKALDLNQSTVQCDIELRFIGENLKML